MRGAREQEAKGEGEDAEGSSEEISPRELGAAGGRDEGGGGGIRRQCMLGGPTREVRK